MSLSKGEVKNPKTLQTTYTKPMKPTSAILLFVLLLSACGTARPVLDRDSTKVEVKTVERIVRDTAFIELPVIIEKVATLDTASTLENKYAKSEASVSGGVLHHSLSTKPVREPVIVETKETVRDSVVFRDRIVKEDIYIEKPLTRWQQFRLQLGSVTLILIVIAILYLLSFFVQQLPKT